MPIAAPEPERYGKIAGVEEYWGGEWREYIRLRRPTFRHHRLRDTTGRTVGQCEFKDCAACRHPLSATANGHTVPLSFDGGDIKHPQSIITWNKKDIVDAVVSTDAPGREAQPAEPPCITAATPETAPRPMTEYEPPPPPRSAGFLATATAADIEAAQAAPEPPPAQLPAAPSPEAAPETRQGRDALRHYTEYGIPVKNLSENGTCNVMSRPLR
jgi:hypothetical protein